MNRYLDPIAAVEQPRTDFIRYLLTAYPLRDPHLRYGLKQLLEQPGNVWQHPYLEGSQPYRTANSVEQLVEQGVLHLDLASLFTPSSRLLYEHQEQAIRAVIEQQHNIVVATGTGSGKTECFLIPMLDMLLKEGDNLSLAGVRALILYPMNALVNDQVKRLRQLLCRQETVKIQFGFYTSRTEKEKRKALEALREEFEAYEPEELRQLFTEEERDSIGDEDLIDRAIEKTSQVQRLSREEIWESPPHILITNYSMLEHMLIRPVERGKIFDRSANDKTFKMLVVDEAHTYDGSKGTEVSMLLERFKVAVGVENKEPIRCIATSASLGDASVDGKVLEFAGELFGESFSQVIRGDRLCAEDRLGSPYTLPAELTDEEILEYLSILELPEPDVPLSQWCDRLSAIVPAEQLEVAKSRSEGDIHKFLWFALKEHPLLHRLINLLSRSPQPWEQVVRSQDLWGVKLPIKLDGTVDDTDAKPALAHLLQLGTLARKNPEDLPLLPVRLHLLFRSLEGLYACINPDCPEAVRDPNCPDRPNRYGRLYLTEKMTCECENCQSPVLEIASCRKCGQAYSLACLPPESRGDGQLRSVPRSLQQLEVSKRIYTLTSGSLDSVTDDEEVEETEEANNTLEGTFLICSKERQPGWLGRTASPQEQTKSSRQNSEKQFSLNWHIPPVPKNTKKADMPNPWDGGYLTKCPACGASRIETPAMGRFISYTDAPLEVMIDSLFDLLPDADSEEHSEQLTRRKILTFSDVRQDAAFFASDFQRTHTEAMYRQLVWQTFQEVKDEEEIASVKQVEDRLIEKFLDISIPHPARNSEDHHLSYVANDPNNPLERRKLNRKDCREYARKRARELLLREFGLPSARRFSLEAMGLLACHLDWSDERLFELVARNLNITSTQAQIFLTGLTDIIRLAGIVDLDGASDYFPETGGDGTRPGMLDKGRSRVYLRLMRDKGEVNATSFLWRDDEKTKQPLPIHRQNRIVAYYWNLFGELPSRESLIWLYELLAREGYLTEYKRGSQSGRQLHWELLNIRKTTNDWCQCTSCQQIYHVPALGEISDTSGLVGIKRCPAYKCNGTLKLFSAEELQIDREETNHYKHLIKNRSVLPLRSQEHTAQLGVVELEKRENRFRRGQINLLSCSTTLEMGVDIGELQAVVLRNFPPHVSNYQQRAGRAGRRTDGVAVTLMYGQRRPHDRFYFEQPEQIIAGSNQIPRLDSGNSQVQERHIRAELLAAFLNSYRPPTGEGKIWESSYGFGAEEVTIADFFSLPNISEAKPDFTTPERAMVCELREWLHSNEAHSMVETWLRRLDGSGTAQYLLDQFLVDLRDFEDEQLKDWNELVSLLKEINENIRNETDRKKRDAQERRRNGVEAELEKIVRRQLHEQLVQASILPIYGFPIDLVRLLTKESDRFNSSKGKHRLQRDRRLALGEYAPGQEVVVDDRVYESVGILRPSDTEKKYYWVCQNCNHFQASNMEEPVDQCPICKSFPDSGTATKKKEYKVVKAFTTDWTKEPKVTPYIKPQRQCTSQIFLINEGEKAENLLPESGRYTLTIRQGGEFFLANQGSLGNGKGFNKQGFAICKSCGRDLSDLVQKEREKKRPKNSSASSQSSRLTHNHPITGRECSASWYPPIHLGHEFRSDLLKISFDLSTKPILLFGSDEEYEDDGIMVSNAGNRDRGLEFWRSLTYALLAASAQVIDVPRTELDGLFVPLADRRAEIIIYDNVPGGAGYSRRIANRFDEVLKKADKIVSSCTCETSCYDCLKTYSNQPFHSQLNRHLVANFLRPIVERVSPDEDLQNFAPNANRVSLSQMADNLPALCRMAGASSLIYLPQLTDELGLNKGSTLPWLNLLTDAVYSMERSGKPLELIVSHLPEPHAVSDSNLGKRDHVKVWRKRLQQWLDQGLVKLYQASAEALPILCLSTKQTSRIALQLHQRLEDESRVWFQTRSSEGVETVLSRLSELRDRARVVQPEELEDPDTIVVFLNPKDNEWRGDLSLPELRKKLEIERVLSGSKVTKVVYRDRYLRVAGAEILADLLQGDGLDSESQVLILTVEDRDASDLSKKLTTVFTRLQPTKNKLKVHVKRWHERFDLPHGRDLEIYRQDGQEYKVIFDKGMAFLEARAGGTYRVTEPTYVVVTRQS